MSEKQVQKVSGTIEVIKDPSTKEFTKADGIGHIHSIGIKLSGEWHNIQSFDSQAKCLEVLNKLDGGKYVKGDNVELYKESKDGRYWNVVSITPSDQVTTEVVKTNEEIAEEKGTPIGPAETINNENTIEKQCCLKCACMLGGIQAKEEALKTAQWFYQHLNLKWLE